MNKLKIIELDDKEYEEMKSFDYDDEITKESREENEQSAKEE